jgi:N-acyl-D-amino-acid deacylase
MVLFDAETILDAATYEDPMRAAVGISRVWVNGVLSYTAEGATGQRAGSYLARGKTDWIQ